MVCARVFARAREDPTLTWTVVIGRFISVVGFVVPAQIAKTDADQPSAPPAPAPAHHLSADSSHASNAMTGLILPKLDPTPSAPPAPHAASAPPAASAPAHAPHVPSAPPAPERSFLLVDTEELAERALTALRQPHIRRIGLDCEGVRLSRAGRLCLVQVTQAAGTNEGPKRRQG